MTNESAESHADVIDIFGAPWMAASPEARQALEDAAQSLAATRVWALGRRGRAAYTSVYDIKTPTCDFIAQLIGSESLAPDLAVARGGHAAAAPFGGGTRYVSIDILYEERRNGTLEVTAMHYEGFGERPLSAQEVECLTCISRALGEISATRSVATCDGVTVSLRGARPVDAMSRWQDVARHVLERMTRWARTRTGWKQAFERSTALQHPALRERAYLFNIPWSTSRTIAEDFRTKVSIDDEQRSWLDAAIDAWTSYWSVTSVADGLASLRDMFTREVRVVPDDGLEAGTVICARVITLADVAYIDARDFYAIDRKDAADLRFAFADIVNLPKNKAVTPQAMRAPLIALELADHWYHEHSGVHDVEIITLDDGSLG